MDVNLHVMCEAQSCNDEYMRYMGGPLPPPPPPPLFADILLN
jgi:hypothetical protein